MREPIFVIEMLFDSKFYVDMAFGGLHAVTICEGHHISEVPSENIINTSVNLRKVRISLTLKCQLALIPTKRKFCNQIIRGVACPVYNSPLS